MKRTAQLICAVLVLMLCIPVAAAEEWIPIEVESPIEIVPEWNEPDSPLLAMARSDGLLYFEDIDAPLQSFLQINARCIFETIRPSKLMQRLAWVTEADLSPYEGTLQDARWLWMFGDLTALTLTDATLDNLNVIAGFTKLETITLLNCGVFDLTPLENCTALTSVTLGWDDEYAAASGTFDLTPLTKLKKLNTIALYGAGITSLEPLTSVYRRVKALTLSHTAISDYAPMKQFAHLDSLTLDLLNSSAVAKILQTCDRGIESLTLRQIIFDAEVQEATARFRGLDAYSLIDCDVADPLFYETLNKSDELTLQNITVGDGTAISEVYADRKTMVLDHVPEPVMISLLDTRSSRLVTLTITLETLSEELSDALRKKTSLNVVTIHLLSDLDLTSDMWKRINGIRDMTLVSQGKTLLSTAFMADLTRIRTLTLSGIAVEDTSGFRALEGLSQLNVYGCRIGDWSFLQDLRRITTMKIYASALTGDDLPMIVCPQALEDLRLNGNDIKDISALTQSQTIRKLDILDNPIEDYSPLLDMPAMRTVFLDQGGVITGNYILARSKYIDDVDYQTIEQEAFGTKEAESGGL